MNVQRVRFKTPGRHAVVLWAALMWATAVQSHHSFAMFDTGKLVAISGTVTRWDWINPHSWLYMDVTKADGTTERWAFECSSPNMMIRWGWNAKDVRIGDKVTVDANLARNGNSRRFGENAVPPRRQGVGRPYGTRAVRVRR